MMVKVQYGYETSGIDGRTEHDDVKTFDSVEDARAWAWSFIGPTGGDGRAAIDCYTQTLDDGSERRHWQYEATWRSVDDEPSSAHVWAQWYEEAPAW